MLKLLALIVMTAPALAQPAQVNNGYVPITIDQKSYDGLHEYLSNQPYKIAQPIVQWLEQEELRAKAAAMKKDTEKPSEGPTLSPSPK